MALLENLRRRLGRGMRHPARTWAMDLMAGRAIDYRTELAPIGEHSAVMAPLLWVARTFPEAPIQLRNVRDDGQTEPVVRHPMVSLIRRPNPFYGAVTLWAATVIDYQARGNGYWLKIRDAQRRVVQLWWAPSWQVEPCGDASTFVTHYEYRPGRGEVYEVPPEDVVHFRFGMDPANPRLGLSPLASVLRELFTDQEAAAFTATLMRNMGVPGMVVIPEGGFTIDGDEAERVKRYVRSHFTGDRRGEPLVMGSPSSVSMFGFSPEQLDLQALRRIPEERVSAVLGVPAVVAGLGAGLDRSTFTNMGEAREMAYESNIVPTQRAMAEELERALLPDFEADPEAFQVAFDLANVRVLAEDRRATVQRVTAVVNGGVASLAEGRRELGLPVGPEHEVFLQPVNVRLVPAERLGADQDTERERAELLALQALMAQRLGGALRNGAVSPDLVGQFTGEDPAALEPAAANSNGNGGGAA